jgi:Flp pilus assembly protein TadD/cell division protein FtsN
MGMKLSVFVLAATLLPQAAAAQYIGGRPPEPPPAPLAGTVETPEAALARNVRLIAINPRNYDALLGAGRAALRLGDPQAAIGFFGRAEEINAAHWAPKAGQGSALAQMGEALAAVGLFEQAQSLGATLSLVALDRGLAFDLLGRQSEAQSDYRAVLAGIDQAEARRRLALSLGISGRKVEALAALDPLLARRDPGARRARALILALGGDVEGARQAIAAMMPGASGGFDPFLRRLPTLGPGQKAAAVHLGIMPSEGAALASVSTEQRPAAVAPPARQAQASPVQASPVQASPVQASPLQTAAVTPKPEPVKVAETSIPETRSPEPKAADDRLASIDSLLTALPPPPPAPKPIVERTPVRRSPAPERALASRPASEPAVPSPKRDAKIKETKPTKEAAKDSKSRGKAVADEEAKPVRAAATTSRIYVQLAGGANADRMGREYERIRKTKASLFRSRQPLVSEVKGWSRLLVGPFKDAEAAQSFVNDLHSAKLEGFVWTAPGGLKLEKLASR